MITPRRTRLVRVADLHAFRETIAHLCRHPVANDPNSAFVVVATRAAAGCLRDNLTRHERSAGRTLPHLVTREQLYDALHARLSAAPRRLTPLERDALAQAAAAHAAQSLSGLPFQLRPGLVTEMLTFYDQLRRQGQTAKRFEELMEDALGNDASGDDRGARRILQQTGFLAEMFRDYEARVARSGACDEHGVRQGLVAGALSPAVRQVILTVADWIGDPDGLFSADFDLLARLPGLEAVDVIATAGMLQSGFHERLNRWLPDLETIDAWELTGKLLAARPVIVVPNSEAGELWWTYRDREEELVAIARASATGGHGEGSTAIVYKLPLPYLYLAPNTLGAAGVAYVTRDGMPLAAEPTAAAVDLVLDFVETAFSRAATVALLRSPHFRFVHRDEEVGRRSTSALDRLLSQARYLGELSRLEELAAGEVPDSAEPALRAALALARELTPIADTAPASQQLARLLAFLTRHARPLDADDPFASRETRARAAVFDLIAGLAAAHASHHDPAWRIEEVATAVRRCLAEETFGPETFAPSGSRIPVCLLDDRAARYGAFHHLALVGLVEDEWPERPRRNIFYPPSLLKALGWPSEKDRRAAAEARFLDLIASASSEVRLSTFTLENDVVALRSSLLDEVSRARLSSPTEDRAEPDREVFPEDALTAAHPDFTPLSDPSRAWAELRASRRSIDEAAFHGHVGRLPGVCTWSVSALETYLGCPFKFFAQHVLRLEEEPDDEEVMDPRRQGAFVHHVFERFFDAWQRAGRRTITPVDLDEARRMFVQVTDRALTSLPAVEAGLERARLLGSPAAAGLGEAVLRMEAERPTPVVERLLEYRLTGLFNLVTGSGTRTVTLRGAADRLDLLADGTFRLIDYKLGWPPHRSQALQLPIYALCAEQRLANHRGRRWTLGEAVYVAFKGPRRVVPLFSSLGERDQVLREAQQRLADTLDAIERGDFPPTPDDVFRCETCSFATVCRKDYVGDV